MQKNSRQRTNAFTLIELPVVIAIIATLDGGAQSTTRLALNQLLDRADDNGSVHMLAP